MSLYDFMYIVVKYWWLIGIMTVVFLVWAVVTIIGGDR